MNCDFFLKDMMLTIFLRQDREWPWQPPKLGCCLCKHYIQKTMITAYKDSSKRQIVAFKDREVSTCLAREPPS